MFNQDLLKGAPEAAKYTGLPVRTIQNMARQGWLPTVKVGSIYFFRKSELDTAFQTGVRYK